MKHNRLMRRDGQSNLATRTVERSPDAGPEV